MYNLLFQHFAKRINAPSLRRIHVITKQIVFRRSSLYPFRKLFSLFIPYPKSVLLTKMPISCLNILNYYLKKPCSFIPYNLFLTKECYGILIILPKRKGCKDLYMKRPNVMFYLTLIYINNKSFIYKEGGKLNLIFIKPLLIVFSPLSSIRLYNIRPRLSKSPLNYGKVVAKN